MGQRFFLFPDSIAHFDFAVSQGYPERLVHSAGFVKPPRMPGVILECYGESESLKRKARPDDTRELNRQLGHEFPDDIEEDESLFE